MIFLVLFFMIIAIEFVLVQYVPTSIGLPIGFVLMVGYIAAVFLYPYFTKPKTFRIIVKNKRVSEHLIFTEEGSSTRSTFTNLTVDYCIEGKKFERTATCCKDIYDSLDVGKEYNVCIRESRIIAIKKSN